MEDLKYIGKRIKEIRKRHKISQEKLAESTGLNHRTILRIENGHTLPTLDTMYKIAQILDCNIKDFLEIDNYKTRSEIINEITHKLNSFTEDELRKFYISFCHL